MENFSNILANYLSPVNSIRSSAENTINKILSNGDPRDLDNFFEALSHNYDNSVKLFIALCIKKVFDQCINANNFRYYQEYVLSRKSDIFNTVLGIKSDLKTINNLVIVLEKCMGLFKEKIVINDDEFIDNTDVSMINQFNPGQVFEYIFQFYNFNKQHNNLQETFQGLYISFKLLKFLKNWENKEKYNFSNTFLNFYEKIIFDFSELLSSFFHGLDKDKSEYDSVTVQYINLYLKIMKHSVIFLMKEQREKIMQLTFEFLYKILQNVGSLNQIIFESIFLSNKILIKYTSYVSKLDIKTIKNFSDLFYVYISEKSLFENIIKIIRMNYDITNSLIKENKFVTDIIDFFKELLQLTAFDNWGDLILFKDCYSDESILISDYLNQEFFTTEKLQNLLIFTITNCMTFRVNEIELAMSDIEEFYTWYDTLSPAHDLREKAGVLCRIIYDKYKKSLKGFFDSIEAELLSITEREIMQGSFGLSFEDSNLRCGMLYFFENLAYIYFNKHRDYEMWVKRIFLRPLDLVYLRQSNYEIFSRFIILRILMKMVDFKEISVYKLEIFTTVYNIFVSLVNLNSNNNTHYMLLKFAALDYFYAYFDDCFTNEVPKEMLENNIFHLCEMLRSVSSPDIHTKIIKTASSILNQFDDGKIGFAFEHLFPILQQLWENNWVNANANANSNINIPEYNNRNIRNFNLQRPSVTIVRQNLIKLISVFVKKIGLFVSFNNHTIVDLDYFQFVYCIIGYSISVKSKESNFLVQESLKLIFLIQDEFSRLNEVNANLTKIIMPAEFYDYFGYYEKIYDFLPIILENLTVSDDYFLAQFLIIEQFIILSQIPSVSEYLNSIDFINKLISITKTIYDKHINNFWQPIFNFIEFCLYILNRNSESNKTLNVESYNNFIVEIFHNIFANFNEERILYQAHNNTQQKISNFPEFNLLLGALQISSRFIYINYKYYNTVSLEFCYSIVTYLYFIINNKILLENVSILNSRILVNLVKNLIRIFTSHGQIENANNLKNLLPIFDNGNFLDKHDHTINHWLFFFNKMNNNLYYYHFTVLEEVLRAFWGSKLEKLNFFEVDLSNVNFDMKYNYLITDEMYKYEVVDDEAGEYTHNN